MEQERRNKKKTKYVIFFIITSVFVLISVYFWKKMQELSIGKIVIPIKEEVALEAPKKVEYQTFEGKYIMFRLPVSFVLKNHKDTFDGQGVILESAFFTDEEIYSDKVAIAIENITGKTMQESADYNFRIKNPSKYQKEEEHIDDFLVTSFFFKENSLYEKVFFVRKKNFLAKIALTSSDMRKDILDKEILDIVKSLKWKE